MESAGQATTWTDVTLIYYHSEFPVYDPESTSKQVEIAWYPPKTQDFRAVARYHMQPPGCRGAPSFPRCVKLYPSHSPIFCTRGHIGAILFTRRLLDIRFATYAAAHPASESWNTGSAVLPGSSVSLWSILDTTGEPRNTIHSNSQDLVCFLRLIFTSDTPGWAIRPISCATSPQTRPSRCWSIVLSFCLILEWDA